MRKPAFFTSENKGADQMCTNCTADQHLCFRYTDSTIPSLQKFQDCSILLWLHMPVFVGPGQKPRRPVFLRRGSIKFQVGLLHDHDNDENCLIIRDRAICLKVQPGEELVLDPSTG